jgi:hypothetical protein
MSLKFDRCGTDPTTTSKVLIKQTHSDPMIKISAMTQDLAPDLVICATDGSQF